MRKILAIFAIILVATISVGVASAHPGTPVSHQPPHPVVVMPTWSALENDSSLWDDFGAKLNTNWDSYYEWVQHVHVHHSTANASDNDYIDCSDFGADNDYTWCTTWNGPDWTIVMPAETINGTYYPRECFNQDWRTESC